MRTFLTLFVLVGVFSLPVSAQDYPKGELFGGYQFTHLNPGINANGWNASITGNVNRWFGVTADFSGAYKNGGKFHTAMAGPVFSLRKSEIVTPFAHVLVGAAVLSGGGTSTAFATAIGAVWISRSTSTWQYASCKRIGCCCIPGESRTKRTPVCPRALCFDSNG